MTYTLIIKPEDIFPTYEVYALSDKEITIQSKNELSFEDQKEILHAAADIRKTQAELKITLNRISLSVLNHAPHEWCDKLEYSELLNTTNQLRDYENKWQNVLQKFSILQYEESFTPKRVIIGIAGGTGSGKSTLATKLKEIFNEHALLIEQDAYYKDLSDLSLEDRAHVNFDHPDSLDFDLLQEHILALQDGHSITKPLYDFKQHLRQSSGEKIYPSQIIIVEGILLFAVEKIRKLFDLKVFVDTDADTRILRRLERDIKERGRTIDNIERQYLTTVKPMHQQFVEPSRAYANFVVPGTDQASTIDETATNVADLIESVLVRKQVQNGHYKITPYSSPHRVDYRER